MADTVDMTKMTKQEITEAVVKEMRSVADALESGTALLAQFPVIGPEMTRQAGKKRRHETGRWVMKVVYVNAKSEIRTL